VKPKVSYFSTGFLPIHFGFTTDPKAYAAELKRLNVTVEDRGRFIARKGMHATTHCFHNEKHGAVILVTLDLSARGRYSVAQIHSLLAHEAFHVWQATVESMGEKAPGDEISAYALQHFTQCMINALGGRK
jgi:hypothetical protein